MDVKRIQQRLKELGFDPGAADGIRRPRTVAAVKALQVARGLAADGIAGSNTLGAPFPVTRPSGTPPPGGYRVAPTWPRQVDCPAFYGAVGARQMLVDLPYGMRLAWDRAVIVRRISLTRRWRPRPRASSPANEALLILRNVALATISIILAWAGRELLWWAA